MAGVHVEAGSELAQSIQSAVQPKLTENGWVAEENDTTLSDYVTMMIVSGKDIADVKSELGGELLGIGEDDPAVGAFAEWLFERVRALAGVAQQAANGNAIQAVPHQDAQSNAMDAQMDDGHTSEGIPSGPKAMRNGGAGSRGRGGRILGQMNNHMSRSELPDPLRRIKGAASGQHGRINTHSGRDMPRGPKGQNMANGITRMMNSGARGGNQAGNPMMPGAAIPGAMMNGMDPQQQMAFMQMMEMQANLMTQMMNGQLGPMQQNSNPGPSMFDRVEKRGGGKFKGRQQRPKEASSNVEGDVNMEVDTADQSKDSFSTECRFNLKCTIPTCPFAHQSPAAPPGQTIDLTDTCQFGVACENRKCTGRHPSPAPRIQQNAKLEVDCKFYPNCTNPNCPFRHPDMPPCRNGADCNVPGCKFTHSKIMCRYSPCTRPACPFKHIEGQRGSFKDKVWTKDGAPNAMDMGEGNDEGKSNRFAEFKQNEAQPEELIIPGQDASSSHMGDTSLIT